MASKKVLVSIKYARPGTCPPVYIAGSFSNPKWKPHEMQYTQNNEASELEFHQDVEVESGKEYQYKFRLGTGDWWVLDESALTVVDSAGNLNNVFIAPHQEEPREKAEEINENESTEQAETNTGKRIMLPQDMRTESNGIVVDLSEVNKDLSADVNPHTVSTHHEILSSLHNNKSSTTTTPQLQSQIPSTMEMSNLERSKRADGGQDELQYPHLVRSTTRKLTVEQVFGNTAGIADHDPPHRNQHGSIGRVDTPATVAAEVAESAEIVDLPEPLPVISDEEAGRIGFRRLSATPIPQVADVAAEVADVAAIVDGDDLATRDVYPFRSSAEIQKSEDEYAMRRQDADKLARKLRFAKQAASDEAKKYLEAFVKLRHEKGEQAFKDGLTHKSPGLSREQGLVALHTAKDEKDESNWCNYEREGLLSPIHEAFTCLNHDMFEALKLWDSQEKGGSRLSAPRDWTSEFLKELEQAEVEAKEPLDLDNWNGSQDAFYDESQLSPQKGKDRSVGLEVDDESRRDNEHANVRDWISRNDVAKAQQVSNFIQNESTTQGKSDGSVSTEAFPLFSDNTTAGALSGTDGSHDHLFPNVENPQTPFATSNRQLGEVQEENGQLGVATSGPVIIIQPATLTESSEDHSTSTDRPNSAVSTATKTDNTNQMVKRRSKVADASPVQPEDETNVKPKKTAKGILHGFFVGVLGGFIMKLCGGNRHKALAIFALLVLATLWHFI